MTRAEKKQRIATVDATVNLTRFLELPKYVSSHRPSLHGLATVNPPFKMPVSK